MSKDGTTGKNWQEIACGLWIVTKRVLAIAAVVVTIYMTAGCVMFREWWFHLLWGGEFNWQFVKEGLKDLLDEHFSLLIGIVVAACVLLILGSIFKARLFRLIDRFAGRLVFVTALLLFTTSLIIYHTEKWRYDLQDALEADLRALDRIHKYYAASNSPPHVVPPVDFQYIDKTRVDQLYNQIEPDLIEKERTIDKTSSAKGKLGAGISGAVTAEAEAGKSESTKQSFARTAFSTERKCVELMNYVVDNRGPKYYTNSRGWFFGRENAALAAEIERNKLAPLDWSKIKPIKPVDEPPTEGEKREAEQKAQQYQTELQNELETLNGYVFIDGDFSTAVNGDTLILTETFSIKPHKAIFRITLPKSVAPEIKGQLRLRVFGDTLRPLKDGYVDVRMISAY